MIESLFMAATVWAMIVAAILIVYRSLGVGNDNDRKRY